ncbi:hypothetical protein X975_09602, partial [Stegodyphus mimosarum]
MTCLTHTFHCLMEEISANYSNSEKLISNINKIFLKAPYHLQCFKS